MQLTDRERATMLAALRYWQVHTTFEDRFSFVQFTEVRPLNDAAIDQLCDKLTTREQK